MKSMILGRFRTCPYIIIILIFLLGCSPCYSGPAKIREISVPAGYERVTETPGSFCGFLRDLNLKTTNNTVYLYDGSPKENQDAQYAVVTKNPGKKDLQQCADAVIRLRAEYLYSQKRYSCIHFNFASGDTADYLKYADGYRMRLNQNKVIWEQKAERNYSEKIFYEYLDMVYTYANTASLSKELLDASEKPVEPGDVFVESARPYGHAVIVVDAAFNPVTHKRIFMLAQSYMPAQEIHVLKNPAFETPYPWFEESQILKTPEWIFKKIHHKRFRND